MYSLSIDLDVLWVVSKITFFKVDRIREFLFRDKSGSKVAVLLRIFTSSQNVHAQLQRHRYSA